MKGHYLQLRILLLLTTSIVAAFDRETVAELKQGTVFIRVEAKDYLSGKEVIGNGSGFFVHSNGYVVTNWHVVRPLREGQFGLLVPVDPQKITVIRRSGKPDQQALDARIVAVDKEHDIAILATEQADTPAIPLGSTADLFETQSLWALGFPLGERFAIIERGPEVTISRGAVTALRHDDLGNLRHIQTDAQFDSGSSGGPIVDETGKVVGIAQSIIVNNRELHFAVPVTFISRLLATINPKTPLPATDKLDLGSNGKRHVYVDGRKADTQVPLGWRQVAIVEQGKPTWVKNLLLKPGAEALLNEVAPPQLHQILPQSPDFDARVNGERVKLPEKGKQLLKLDFADRAILKTMRQDTGGTRTHTWYIKDGQLRQHVPDGLLHAIYAGDTSWADYSFSVDVQIDNARSPDNAQSDPRAGLIFRETEGGFYLFRLHSGNDKAQLAYHAKQPFGWFILGETKLDLDITDKANRLTIMCSGPNITCLLNGKPILRMQDHLARSGRIGFYSVESKATFDNAVVHQINGGDNHQIKADGYKTFWFSDSFNANSVWWSHRLQDGSPSEPWIYTDGGAVHTHDDNQERLMLIEKYALSTFAIDTIMRVGDVTEDTPAKLGIVFGHRNENGKSSDYRIVFSNKDKTCSLIQRKDGKSEVIGKTEVTFTEGIAAGDQSVMVFGAPICRLVVKVHPKSVEVATPWGRIANFEIADGAIPTGRVGFSIQGTKVIFHQLTLANGNDQ